MAPTNQRPVSLRDELRVEPGKRVALAKLDPGRTFGHEKESSKAKVERDVERIADLQERVWAERSRRILIVLQGIDASGKDGAIKHLMSGLHPLGAKVVGFGVPSEVELAHDYLWRVHQSVPANGEVAIFNRSHYEDVLVVRVHSLVPEARWSRRYEQINAFERTLADEGTTIMKFFLHIDPAEQLERFRARLQDPSKRWKFRVGDLDERKRWDDYAAAYEEALEKCSTDVAPWYVIPANRKWFRDLALGEIVADTIDDLKPAFPERPELPRDLPPE